MTKLGPSRNCCWVGCQHLQALLPPASIWRSTCWGISRIQLLMPQVAGDLGAVAAKKTQKVATDVGSFAKSVSSKAMENEKVRKH